MSPGVSMEAVVATDPFVIPGSCSARPVATVEAVVATQLQRPVCGSWPPVAVVEAVAQLRCRAPSVEAGLRGRPVLVVHVIT